MSQLLMRPEVFTNRIESFGYEYLSFEARRMKAGTAAAAISSIADATTWKPRAP